METMEKKKNDEKRAQQFRAAMKIIEPLTETCCRRTEHWWTFELCVCSKIRQFHLERISRSTSSLTQEYSLGSYHGGDKDVNQITDRDGTLALLQQFTVGTPCDINNKYRTALVRYRCMPGVKTKDAVKLVRVEETQSCMYELDAHVPALCSLPGFTPPAEDNGRLQEIGCYLFNDKKK